MNSAPNQHRSVHDGPVAVIIGPQDSSFPPYFHGICVPVILIIWHFPAFVISLAMKLI